ncbi:MAG: RNA 3'-terminal phosphate cyclase [Planctomycetes bacterium]|nr:RNA 3'-terminal phosphate cyclase [Planctomycetota bacterium]
MIVIDGEQGEGGGQILRSALSLSGCTGQPFVLNGIRAGRKKPGLMRQHLTCVLAAAQVCNAEVEGAEVGSKSLTFRPSGSVYAGNYTFPIGSAGSTTLVLQTVWPLLAIADAPSRVTVTGGTHNPAAPTVDFLTKCFVPAIAALGHRLEVTLHRHGFAPAGGGRVEAAIEPADGQTSEPFALHRRGDLVLRRAVVHLANLEPHIANRELDVVRKKLGFTRDELHLEELDRVQGQGNVLTIEHEFDHVTHLATGFGKLGVRAEQVAARASSEVRSFLATDAPVGAHLADQLLLPLALRGGGTFRTVEPTLHTRTNAEIVDRFTGRTTRIRPDGDGTFHVTVA